jgi:alpha-tubulin suppressor-like RCC1 family protein
MTRLTLTTFSLCLLAAACSNLADDCTRTLTCSTPHDDAGPARDKPDPSPFTDDGSGGEEDGDTGEARASGTDTTRNTETPANAGPYLGAPCASPGALACNGSAQKLTLVCQGGIWTARGTCLAQQNCAGELGICMAILPACSGTRQGPRHCSGREIRTCDADLVTDSLEQTCNVGCVEDEAGPRCSVAVQVVAGAIHSCALLDTGAVRCWGNNVDGKLGYGHALTIGDDELPASEPLVDAGGKVVQLTAGSYHTCALLEGGAVRCWGNNAVGQLGYGHTNDIGIFESPAAAPLVEIGGPAVQVAAGANHTCALLEDGTIRCWGDNTVGQLGYGHQNNIGDDEKPISAGAVQVRGAALQLTAGTVHSCALLEGGVVRCWGSGSAGQLGLGRPENVGDDEFPSSAPVVPVGGAVAQVAAGYHHTCATLVDDTVRCWGMNIAGQLGIVDHGSIRFLGDDELASSAPSVNLGGAVLQLSGGYNHTCALLRGGGVRCWGNNMYGALGYGNITPIGDDEAPAQSPLVPVGGVAVELSAGMHHTCALLDSGAVRCWGQNSDGQLGYGHLDDIGDDEPPSVAGDVELL